MKRHLTCFCLLLLVFFCVFMMGCSRQIQEPLPQKAEVPSAVSTNQNASGYHMIIASEKYNTVFSLPEQLSIVSSAVADHGSTYLWGCSFQEEQSVDWIIQYKGTKATAVNQLHLSERGYVISFDAASDEIYYLEQVDQDDGSFAWILHGLNTKTELEWPSETSRLSSIAIPSGKDIVHIVDGNKIQTCDLSNGELLHTAVAESDITQIFRIEDGTVIAYCEKNGKLFSVEGDGERLAERGQKPCLSNDSRVISGLNSGYDCLIVDETALYGWDIGSTDITQILLFDSYGLVSNNLSAFVSFGANSFLGATWRSGDPQDRLFWMTPSDDAQIAAEERVLRIAGISRPMVLSAAISDFKALCPEYRVEYVDYAEKYGNQALQKLQIDLVQGVAPDLLFVNGLPVESYIKQGMLEELYQWIDSDADLNRAQFTENLLEVLESYDQKLYQIPQSYSIATTACKSENHNDDDNWTFAAVNRTMETKPELLSAFYGESKETMAKLLPLYMIHTLVDYESAKSNFDNTEAIEFLTFLNRMETQVQYNSENELDALKDGEILFAQILILSPDDFSYVDEAFQQTLTYPGYPNAPGGSFYLNLPMAIPTTANEKIAAWKFMKMIFSSELYATRGGWIPLQQGFEKSLREAEKRGISTECLDRLGQLQSGIHNLAYYDEAVSDIVLNETSYLFADARSVEETVKQIHQRVQLYLSEQYS